ncbi:MAG: hypothetical protein HeimC2_16150 [Candidatus Heimdallarchaeota archaeon LC_2]|nr:MAG: hypothetical protein HeimC2_16150 [Candidatus Heimdallarchaeota archaeon LC_2]
MSVARHVTQILHNEEVGPAEVELLMSKLKQVLVKKMKVRAFISLAQTIEDSSDPRSKYHDKTVDKILESFEVSKATFYRKSKRYKQSGLDGIIPKIPGPKSSRLP